MDVGNNQKEYFTKALLNWNETENQRELPWKSEKDPYKIWLSEIILQQTRALQGLPYYQKFITTYPTVKDMARAPDEEVFRIWQGLGYYNRCRNMLATARAIATDRDGVFPNTFDDILQLKGIGPYTAAAIASFAFGLPHAVLDGNVYRVLSRYMGIDTPTDTTAGKALFTTLAAALLHQMDSAAYNQAIMDLGATICTPRNPHCNECPVAAKCIARNDGTAHLLPIKSKKIVVSTRYFHYIIFKYDDQIWIHKRTDKDIWQNLYQPFLVEHDAPLDVTALRNTAAVRAIEAQQSDWEYAGAFSQKLTHRIIQTRFFTATLTAMPFGFDNGMWVTHEALQQYAFPKTIVAWLERHNWGGLD